MNFSVKNNPFLIPGLFAFSFLIFIVDCMTPLGQADYIFYFIPVALSMFTQNAKVPIHLALLTTALSIVGFNISPESNFDFFWALINRAIAGVTIWITCILATRLIFIRNKVQDLSWVRQNLARFAKSVSGDVSLTEIGHLITSFLEETTGMKMAACYHRTNLGHKLHLFGKHALPEDFDRDILNVGMGLLGQAVVSKKANLLEGFPEDFYKIQGVTGTIRPKFVYVQPFLSADECIGAMEVAYLNRPTDPMIMLLNEMAEIIAQALISVHYKERLSVMLTESQRMTEELQSQQEELRVNNEELEAQSKTVKEAYNKLERQQAQLEENNAELEAQAQTLEEHKLRMDEQTRNLVRKSEELIKANQYKSEFLANMSHELRTPLNSTLILARLLADNKQGNLTDEQVKQAEIIHQSGNDLLNLINDILDLSKVEAGKMVVHNEKVSLEELIFGLNNLFLPIAQNKGIAFEIQKDQGLPHSFITDRIRVEQILKNFLSNAFKFTDKGSVRLQIRRVGKQLRFDVIDSGIGIPEEQLKLIFEAFHQADGTAVRKYGGTGLGLSISRQLAGLLGGHIEASSSQREGSTFTLHLPLKEITETQGPPRPQIVSEERLVPFNQWPDDRHEILSSSRRLLIIEDDEFFAKELYEAAHEMDFKAMIASSVDEALSLIEKFPPSAICLDIRLPDHNGLMVLDYLKGHSKTRHIPVHVISGTDLAHSALSMGAVGYSLKPVKKDGLKEALRHLSELSGDVPKRVLIVEDDQVQQQSILQLLRDSGIETVAVSTGTEGLKNLKEGTFDCMIMDLTLPDLSGLGLLEQLTKKGSPYSYPPVIVYTARDILPHEEERLRQFSNSIVIKGAKSPERLLNEVSLFLHKVETDLPPEKQKVLGELRGRDFDLDQKKVLIVDDDVRNIFALTSVLESHGAKIVIARNGREALEKVKSDPKLDIVLMDIMMPEMDGLEATKVIRSDEKHDKLPIIALTAKAMKDDQERCLQAGANDYLPKPINTDKLLSLMRVWLRDKGSFIS